MSSPRNQLSSAAIERKAIDRFQCATALVLKVDLRHIGEWYLLSIKRDRASKSQVIGLRRSREELLPLIERGPLM